MCILIKDQLQKFERGFRVAAFRSSTVALFSSPTDFLFHGMAFIQRKPSVPGHKSYVASNAPELTYEGLEVDQPGLEVKPTATYNQANIEQKDAYSLSTSPVHHHPYPREKRILGLRRATFWLTFALVVAVIAAIAAGVTAAELHIGSKGGLTKGNAPPGDTRATTTITATTTAASQTTVYAATTTLNSYLSPTVVPVSDCHNNAGQNFTATQSGLSYTRACNVSLNSQYQTYNNIFVAPQPTFEHCIIMCDSYNFWMKTTNMTVAVWNWIGDGHQAFGSCWCVHVDGHYDVTVTPGQDAALQAGTFDASSLP